MVLFCRKPKVARIFFHRKCLLCIHFDDDWDPVALHFGRQEPMAWGKPPNAKGETITQFCYYCVKVYCGLYRDVGNSTITAYHKSLDEQKLKQHMQLVATCIKGIIEKGGTRSTPMDWEAVQDFLVEAEGPCTTAGSRHTSVSDLIKRIKCWFRKRPRLSRLGLAQDNTRILASNAFLNNSLPPARRPLSFFWICQEEAMRQITLMETVIKRPGLSIMTLEDYVEEHGELATNGLRSKGHYEFEEDGVKKVGIPDKITRIEYNERHQIEKARNLDTGGDMPADWMARRQRGIADAMGPAGFTGGFLGGADRTTYLLGGGSGAAQDGGFGSNESPSKHGGHGAAASKAKAAAGPPSAKKPRLGEKEAVTLAAPSKPTGKASGSKAAVAAKSGGRGRPRKDWNQELDKLVTSFFEAPSTDPLFWGSESKTQVKLIQQALKDVATRTKVVRISHLAGGLHFHSQVCLFFRSAL